MHTAPAGTSWVVQLTQPLSAPDASTHAWQSAFAALPVVPRVLGASGGQSVVRAVSRMPPKQYLSGACHNAIAVIVRAGPHEDGVDRALIAAAGREDAALRPGLAGAVRRGHCGQRGEQRDREHGDAHLSNEAADDHYQQHNCPSAWRAGASGGVEVGREKRNKKTNLKKVKPSSRSVVVLIE